MDINETISKKWPDGWMNLPLYGTYIVLGFVIAIGNGIIVCSVLRYEALRESKIHLIIGALAAADALHMLAYISAGIYRGLKVLDGTHSHLVRPWYCWRVVHALIWSFSHSQSTLMLSVLSLDRLFSVTRPLEYLSWKLSYAWKMIGFAFIYTWFMAGLGIASTYKTRSMDGAEIWIPITCIPVQAFKRSNKLYGSYFGYAPATFSMISIALYVCVWMSYKRHNAKQRRINQSKNTQLARERQMTKNLRVSTICTFWFYGVPYLAGTVTTWMGYSSINIIFWILAMVNPGCNLFIYPLRMKEMQIAIRALFTGKQLPTNLDLWQKNRKKLELAAKSKTVGNRKSYKVHETIELAAKSKTVGMRKSSKDQDTIELAAKSKKLGPNISKLDNRRKHKKESTNAIERIDSFSD